MARDANGCFGGEVAMWDPQCTSFKAYGFFGGIILFRHIQGFRHRLHLVNLYAPYKDRVTFWQRMVNCGIFLLDHLLIVGDFNTTLDDAYIWGKKEEVIHWQVFSRTPLILISYVIYI